MSFLQDPKQALIPHPLSPTLLLPPTQIMMRLTLQMNLNPLKPPQLPPHGLWIQPKMPASLPNLTPSLWLMKNYISSRMGEQISLHFLAEIRMNTTNNKQQCSYVNDMFWSSGITGGCPAGMEVLRDRFLFLRDGQLCQLSLTLPLKNPWLKNCTSFQVMKFNTVYKAQITHKP